jgi:SNF2 family DNA or RNA helicase
MRSDLEMLSGIVYDYLILDEAQAIKNESTQLARAACSLTADHRLALSGTPVENRIQELWSIFRFLNPGMLEGATDWTQTSGLETLARCLRPFILRRTKEQVLPELPGKTVSDVFCELDTEQRKTYDELAAHYRATLLKEVEDGETKGFKIHVLEALLRLRQLACHPGLIDPARTNEPSAKLDLLFEHIDEVANSGRKCLIFSQFTSLLSIVRARLDQAGTAYAYLDGATRDRKEVVERFQTQDDVKIFLISLKAGGSGLNLTAADYCFILDPWWNPATEAQAIDRAHRLGQKNHVFAYRLIARGTIEEKILHLQAKKRKIVEGIFAEDGDILAKLSPSDLNNLLG